MELPPGFRFQPTEEELVLHFLCQKASSVLPSHPENDLVMIPDLNLSTLHHPRMLRGRALWGGKDYYFFSRTMTNREMKSGFWKESGVEEPIFDGGTKLQIGVKKLLLFFDVSGDQAQGEIAETNWVMEEYHLCHAGSSDGSAVSYTKTRPKRPDCSQWVLCRVHERGDVDPPSSCNCNDLEDDEAERLSDLDEMFLAIEDDDL